MPQRRTAAIILCIAAFSSIVTVVQRKVVWAVLSPELSLSADAQPMVQIGGLAKYTVTVTNRGFGDASSVVITYTLPSGFTYEPGSTRVEEGGELISSSDPYLDGQFLAWGPFSIPRAAAVFDNHFGIHTFVQDLCLESYVDFQLDKALQLVGLGGHVTQLVYPVTVSTQGPNPCWVHFVNAAYERNLVPILRLQGEWAGGYWIKPQPDSPGDYTSLAEAYMRVVEGLPRRDGHTLYIQVWNEPDLPLEWSGQPSASEYGSFFVDVAAAIHSIGDPRIQVLNGPLTPGNASFVRQLVNVPGFAQSFDLWASHCYPLNHPPQYNIHDGTARYRQYTIDCYLLELQALATYGGRRGVKVMLSEAGYGLYDRTFRFEGYPTIDEDNRANYMKRAFRDFWASWPEVVGVTPFELVDPYGTWPRWDWLYPGTDVPHAQFNAVKALPKPEPLDVIPSRLTISFRAEAAGSPGVYHSDVSATAEGTTVSPLTGVAPVMVVDELHLRHFPLAARNGGAGLEAAAEAARELDDLLSQLESTEPPAVSLPGPVVPLTRSEEPSEAPQVLKSIEVGPDPQAIALDPLAQRAYVTLGNGGLAVVDTSAESVVCTLTVGQDPVGVAVNVQSGLVYVANSGNGTVSVVDGSECRLADMITGLSRPSGLAVDEAADRIYVTDTETGILAVAAGDSHQIVARIPVGLYPDAVATGPDHDFLYVANAGDGTLTVIDGSSLEVTATIPIVEGPLLGMAVDRQLGQAYIVYLASPLERELAVVDIGRAEVVSRLGLVGGVHQAPTCAYGVAVDEGRGRLYIADGSELLIVDSLSHALTASMEAETVTYNYGLAVDPSRHRVYLLDSSRGRLLVIAD